MIIILIKRIFMPILIVGLLSCGRTYQPTVLTTAFDTTLTPQPPNYDNNEYWAALPFVKDMADSLPPNSKLTDGQATAQADVFFVHPTTFTFQPTNQYKWNADVNDRDLNKKTDESTILNQATPFNGACKVYAPRYRQAHIFAYYTQTADGQKALDIAYSDVKAAFEYYLKHYNNGRPIVIASHSQGTTHCKRLVKEFFDGTPLQKQLVAAYLVGIATPPNYFANIKPISKPGEIGTFASWNTYSKGFYPNNFEQVMKNALCTNPLLWNSSSNYANYDKNMGGVGQNFQFVRHVSDAQVHEGLLWIGTLKIRGAALVKTKVWHRADINFFYNNIRENVNLQVKNYLQQKQASKL
jgi:Protein of unknown function (DUF3089)